LERPRFVTLVRAKDCSASDCAEQPWPGRDFASPATSGVNHSRNNRPPYRKTCFVALPLSSRFSSSLNFIEFAGWLIQAGSLPLTQRRTRWPLEHLQLLGWGNRPKSSQVYHHSRGSLPQTGSWSHDTSRFQNHDEHSRERDRSAVQLPFSLCETVPPPLWYFIVVLTAVCPITFNIRTSMKWQQWPVSAFSEPAEKGHNRIFRTSERIGNLSVRIILPPMTQLAEYQIQP